MRPKTVAVSRLADYAADPEGFIRRKGKVRNAAAAKAGARHHDALGKASSLGWWLLVAALIVGLVLVGQSSVW